MNIRGVYYMPGGITSEGKPETPHLLGPDGKVYFEIRCSVCHYGQCKEITIATSPRRKQNLIFADPCPRCLEAATQNREVEVIPLRELPHDYEELE